MSRRSVPESRLWILPRCLQQHFQSSQTTATKFIRKISVCSRKFRAEGTHHSASNWRKCCHQNCVENFFVSHWHFWESLKSSVPNINEKIEILESSFELKKRKTKIDQSLLSCWFCTEIEAEFISGRVSWNKQPVKLVRVERIVTKPQESCQIELSAGSGRSQLLWKQQNHSDESTWKHKNAMHVTTKQLFVIRQHFPRILLQFLSLPEKFAVWRPRELFFRVKL